MSPGVWLLSHAPRGDPDSNDGFRRDAVAKLDYFGVVVSPGLDGLLGVIGPESFGEGVVGDVGLAPGFEGDPFGLFGCPHAMRPAAVKQAIAASAVVRRVRIVYSWIVVDGSRPESSLVS